MIRFTNFVRVALIVAALGLVPASAKAQEADAGGIQIYRAAAITAGAVAGVVVAGIVTEGLIIPAYVWAAGGPGAVGAGAGPIAAAMSAPAQMGGALMAAANEALTFSAANFVILHNIMGATGAVAGGLWGDAWYRNNNP